MKYFSIVIIPSALLWVELGAIANVDVEEPSVIRSPDLGRKDYFGWTAVFHNIQAGNTRLVCCKLILIWLFSHIT